MYLSDEEVRRHLQNEKVRELNHLERALELQNPLEALGIKHGATKRNHDYLRHYYHYFSPIRTDVRRVLEIGIETGNSLRMWEEFFPNAEIHGIDIEHSCKDAEKGRCRVWIGSQSDPAFLQELIQDGGGQYDIIIDDGSHIPEHQLFTLRELLPHVINRGIYVIEDIGVTTGNKRTMVNDALKSIIDKVNYWPEGIEGHEWQHLLKFPEQTEWLSKYVTGISFYRYITFIFRGRNPEDNQYLREIAENRFK